MYGKYFDSTFTGSMMGAGPTVFAVWGYVIAHTVEGQVELNPKLLAVIIGTTEEDICAAIAFLEAPDVNSRTPDEDGRRMIREGQFAYRVVNHSKYKELRSEDQRREYMREYMRKRRSKEPVNEPVNLTLASLAHTEAEANTEAEAKKSLSLADERFEKCWEAYPLKKGKTAAKKSFKAQIKTVADFLALQQAIENYKQDLRISETSLKFTKHGSTFFTSAWRDFTPDNWTPVTPDILTAKPKPDPNANWRPIVDETGQR